MKSLFQFVIVPALLVFSYLYGGEVLQEIKAASTHPSMPQTEIKTGGPLLAADGSLNEVGYTTLPIRDFNEKSLTPWQAFRLKKWDYFDVMTDQVVITFALADIYYLGDIRLNVFDYTTRQYKTFKKSLLPTQIPKLAPTSYRFTTESVDDNIALQSGGFKVNIENIGGEATTGYDARKISITAEDIGLNLEVTMGPKKGQEAMVGIIPLTPQKKNFFYTIKQPNMFAEGTLKVGDKTYEFTKKNANSFIDWGRGVWNYNSYWVFGRGQGFLENGKRFSLNFAYGYGHNETMSANEDAFFIDTTLYKLNTVEPIFDDNNLMNPWTFKTLPTPTLKNSECDLIFAPHFVDPKTINVGFAKNDMRVTYGQFSGWVSDEKGTQYKFESLNGYVEVFKAKW